MAEGRLERWLAPRTVFRVAAVVAVLAIAAEMLARQVDPAEVDPRPTSWSYAPNGTRGLYEVLGRLGWGVRRSEVPLRVPLDSTATYVILASQEDLTGREVGALLDAARRGAGIVLVPNVGSTFSDSLGISRRAAFFPLDATADSGAAAADTDGDSAAPARGAGHEANDAEEEDEGESEFLTATALPEDVRWYLHFRRPLPPDTTVFSRGLVGDEERVVAVGIPFGRGQLVPVADPRLFGNEVVRDDGGAVLPVRVVEYAGAGRGVIVFDEYHNGYGRHANVLKAVGRLLRETPGGRSIAQLALAGVVLLVAAGVRALPARPRLRLERRSPFEHVGALAQAYEQAGASRVAARRLLRGLRRRHPAALKGDDDEAALQRLTTRYPTLAPAASALLAAARTPLPPRDFRALAEHVDAIERTLAAP
jgi:hypothetical protein